MCVNITINDDRIPEEDETFQVEIIPDPRVDPEPDGETTVTILDNGNVYGLHLIFMHFVKFLDCLVQSVDCADL